MQKEKKRVPKLRFAGFEGEWEKITLGEICTLQTGSKDTQDRVDDGLYPFYVRSNTIERINSYSFDKEAILTSGDGAGVGKIYHLVNGKFEVHQRVYALTDFVPSYSIEYTYHFFSEKFYKRVMRLSAKNSVDSVRRDMIFDMIMPHPQIEEQQKIATFLTSIDTRIQQLEKKKTLLEQYKKGVMQKIFSQEIRFKKDNGEEFGKWEKKRLGEIANITTGSSNRQDSTLTGEYTFFDRSVDIRTSSIYLFEGEAVIVAGEGSDFIPKYFVGKFDLHQRTYAIMNYKGAIGRFLYYILYYYKNYFLQQAVGSTVKSLRLPMFQKMPLLLPCLEEQTKIAQFLSALDTKIAVTNEQVERTKEWKKGLLQRMFV